MTVQILIGDALDCLREMPDQSAQCCVTSPPYFGLRDYGVEGQMGLEPTPDEYVAGMVALFAEVRRVLRDDGTLWLNIGDSYAGSWGAQSRGNTTGEDKATISGKSMLSARQIGSHPKGTLTGSVKNTPGIKPKDLIGIPWLLAFALRADGWYLRQDIIWSKPNPMPESVRDRCTKAHEYIFMFSKSARYHYDSDAIAEDAIYSGLTGQDESGFKNAADFDGKHAAEQCGGKRNKRSVWTVATRPFPDAHFATFPPSLIEPCILASCPIGGTVLDPFGGSGTTGLVADRLRRDAVLIELNPEYAAMARRRIDDDRGALLNAMEAA